MSPPITQSHVPEEGWGDPQNDTHSSLPSPRGMRGWEGGGEACSLGAMSRAFAPQPESPWEPVCRQVSCRCRLSGGRCGNDVTVAGGRPGPSHWAPCASRVWLAGWGVWGGSFSVCSVLPLPASLAECLGGAPVKSGVPPQHKSGGPNGAPVLGGAPRQLHPQGIRCGVCGHRV